MIGLSSLKMNSRRVNLSVKNLWAVGALHHLVFFFHIMRHRCKNLKEKADPIKNVFKWLWEFHWIRSTFQFYFINICGSKIFKFAIQNRDFSFSLKSPVLNIHIQKSRDSEMWVERPLKLIFRRLSSQRILQYEFRHKQNTFWKKSLKA